jgi:SAM-dependent methyltransferase
LNAIPPAKNDLAIDLGCSVGFVTRLLGERYKEAIGVDNDEALLRFARENSDKSNVSLMNRDLNRLSLADLPKPDVFWMSFTLAYIADLNLFIKNIFNRLRGGGLLAILEIDGLFSRHLKSDDPFYPVIAEFELKSELGKKYDFLRGGKIKPCLVEAGFKIVYYDDNCPDPELNFSGRARPEIIENWELRLGRMQGLKEYLGREQYHRFNLHFIEELQKDDHHSNGVVQFIIGRK